MLQADFNVEIVDGVIVIFDEERGGRTVTNDAARVLRRVAAGYGPLAGRTVIYRDTMRVYDGIAVDEYGQFAGFYPLGERVLERAVNKARNRVLYEYH